jgi:hypothetical protein
MNVRCQMTMRKIKVGDIVVVRPARCGLYLVIEEDPDRENNWPQPDGEPMGKLYKLLDPQSNVVFDMHEKWIRISILKNMQCI